MRTQTLSLMLNDNGNGTHCFRLFGANNKKTESNFGVGTLESLIKAARLCLRSVSWEDEEPWDSTKKYKYATGGLNLKRLRNDLLTLALQGYEFWFKFTQKINRNYLDLAAEMLKPASLEFAVKDASEAAYYMFPAALIYDYRMNTRLNLDEYTLCPSFLSSLESNEPLEETECFKGNCPSRTKDLSVVCPSGFWGFRHSIGVPLGSESETNHEITYQDAPKITVATYPSFQEWPSHQLALNSIQPGNWVYASTAKDTFAKLRSENSHIVYFYCHGGFKNDKPFIKVGAESEKGISPIDFATFEIKWDNPQPVVFVNGCHTIAMDPRLILDFASTFVISLHAAGVIGTEITIFEPLACEFAEEWLRRFLVLGETVGEATLKTRLKLLKEGNPLGLVYTAYTNPSLRLKKAGAVSK
jgi:hypothetical protein